MWHNIRSPCGHSIDQDAPVNSEGIEKTMCGTCNEREAVCECDVCLRPLCKTCRSIEVWCTPKEDVAIRYFCPQCRENDRVNPQKRGARVFGLGQVTDMVNQEQGRANRFRIKLKI